MNNSTYNNDTGYDLEDDQNNAYGIRKMDSENNEETDFVNDNEILVGSKNFKPTLSWDFVEKFEKTNCSKSGQSHSR